MIPRYRFLCAGRATPEVHRVEAASGEYVRWEHLAHLLEAIINAKGFLMQGRPDRARLELTKALAHANWTEHDE